MLFVAVMLTNYFAHFYYQIGLSVITTQISFYHSEQARSNYVTKLCPLVKICLYYSQSHTDAHNESLSNCSLIFGWHIILTMQSKLNTKKHVKTYFLYLSVIKHRKNQWRTRQQTDGGWSEVASHYNLTDWIPAWASAKILWKAPWAPTAKQTPHYYRHGTQTGMVFFCLLSFRNHQKVWGCCYLVWCTK